MRICAFGAVVGALALTAVAVPAAHADGRPPDILNVTVNNGQDVVIGTTTKLITATVTASDPLPITNGPVTLYHGGTDMNDDEFDAVLMPTTNHATCSEVDYQTWKCKITINGNPTLLTNSTAGTWHVYAQAYAGNSSYTTLTPNPAIRVLRASRLTVNASPEPVSKGRTITVVGKLSRAWWDDELEYHGYANQPVKLQFRKAGSSIYNTVKTVHTNVYGNLKTTVTASADGYWRYYFAGSTTTAVVRAAGDYVDVR
ncbi:calcium-binding protein [Streptomyces cellulosae]|uniref:Calcium-binding protein n=1 Tax=Streptomyces cellulosae TaxID=1968 RepID=A0ABW7YHK6_STRCE